LVARHFFREQPPIPLNFGLTDLAKMITIKEKPFELIIQRVFPLAC
jgi:hypothetical protein